MWATPLLATALASLLISYLLIPSLYLALLAPDDLYEHTDGPLARVAARNPFRETGPPACMAKLIMLRHKVQQTNTRKRRTLRSAIPRVQPYCPPQSASVPVAAPRLPSRLHQHPKAPPSQQTAKRPRWMPMHMRFGRPFGKTQYH